MNRTWSHHSVRMTAFLIAAGLVGLATSLAAQTDLLTVKDGIVQVDGPTTVGAVDLHIKSLATGDAVLGLGVAPDFFGGNQNALIFGYNGAFEEGTGFIGTRPGPGSGNISIWIENFKEATFSAAGLNLEAGNDFSVNGVTLNVPDYVFEDDYDLMPIEELAGFVATRKHLPGVPSEGEIKSGGLGLGGFQMRLLEKLEELTLYTIAQERKITAVEERNSELEANNARLQARLVAIEERLTGSLP